jgi:cytoskeletal protein RodZ
LTSCIFCGIVYLGNDNFKKANGKIPENTNFWEDTTMKTLIGLAIGIILTAAVLIPISNARTQAELETQRTQTELAAAQAEIEALKTAQIPEKTELTAEPPTATEPAEILTTETSQEISQTEPLTVVKAEEVTATEQKAVEVKAESTPTPTAKPEVKPTSPPQVKNEYPKEFYIDGQKYAYLTAYAEETGQKTFIADEDEPASTQLDYYDPSQDPLSQVKGPFN